MNLILTAVSVPPSNHLAVSGSYPSDGDGEADGAGSVSDEDAAGEALGEGDASVLAFFFAGVGDAEAVPASFFFAVVEEVELADVPVFFAVVAVAVVDFLPVVVALVVVADVSLLCAQDAMRPIAAETAMKGNRNFFIRDVVFARECSACGQIASIFRKTAPYSGWR
jgi:hypothetical protein